MMLTESAMAAGRERGDRGKAPFARSIRRALLGLQVWTWFTSAWALARGSQRTLNPSFSTSTLARRRRSWG